MADEPRPSAFAETLFPGTGESAREMRSIDWSATPLGPIDRWPASLRALVPVMLASRFAMRILWGPEYILLYNDSYRPVLGPSKHPSAMASRIAESFREVWDIVGPLFRRVYAGEAVALEDSLLPIERNGYLEECYFTLSYSPIRDDHGAIGGLLGVVHETTHRVLAERRLHTLRDLAAHVAHAVSAARAFQRAAETLAENQLDVPFALFYSVTDGGRSARLTSATVDAEDPRFTRLAPEIALAADETFAASGQRDARDAVDDGAEARSASASTPAPAAWPLDEASRAKKLVVVADVALRFGRVRSGPYSEPVREAAVIPLFQAGTGRPYGFFVAGINPRRAFDDAYREFLQLAAEHISSAVSDALDREIHERLEARERAADERLRLLFNEAPAAVALLRGPGLVFELANPLYCRLVGRTELVGRGCREAVPELDAQGVWDLVARVYETGEPFFGREFPARLDRHGNGVLDEGYFNFTVQPMRAPDGPIEGVMIFAVEITDQVLARRSEEEARAAAEAGRAERLDLLAREQAARAEAERSNKAKDEFLAVVSHELRNPLSAMLGWTRLLRTGALSEEKREHGLKVIERNAVNQSQLVEDILDVSRILSGKLGLDVKQVSFEEVVSAAIDSARPALDAKEQRLEAKLAEGAVSLMGDATRLQQVAWNLLTNAIKFTPRGGMIEVTLARVGEMLELTVTDSGQGIAPAFLPHVFERFTQADPTTTRQHGGLGLGLSIAKNVVEMHGGTILARSDGPGSGASFVVSLPVAAPRTALSSSPRPLRTPPLGSRAVPAWECPPELVGLRVLVVDDEPDAREMVATVLQRCGAIVTLAGSAREAMARLDEALPDVVLSDIGMPGEDGYALVRRVRARRPEAGGTLPMASLTAYAGAEDRRRALKAGFNAHVPKPVEPSELVATVATLSRIARALR